MQSENIQLQSVLNAIRCIDQRFVLKDSSISCLALMNLSNLRTTILQAKMLLLVARYINSYNVFWGRLIIIDMNLWLSG